MRDRVTEIVADPEGSFEANLDAFLLDLAQNEGSLVQVVALGDVLLVIYRCVSEVAS